MDIKKEAFYECGLTSVTIPESVTNIEYRAFYNCPNLTSVTLGGSIQHFGLEVFGACRNLTSVTNLARYPAYIGNRKLFYMNNSYIELHIRKGMKPNYNKDNGWVGFKQVYDDMEAFDPTSIISKHDLSHSSAASRKVVKDGEVIIQKNGRTYSVAGQLNR